jgi:hypothetical protein
MKKKKRGEGRRERGEFSRRACPPLRRGCVVV